jgi:hypothetical protein
LAILILGGEDDDHAAHMLEHLRASGAETELLDSRYFPGFIQISFDPATQTGWIRLPGGRKLDFQEIAAVYWRAYHGILWPELPDPEQAQIAQNDARSLLESLLIGLPARWVNGWNAFQLHQTKPVQLARVAALGIPVPATLCTNDPEAVQQFASDHSRAIFKPVQGGAHARHVEPRHLEPENLASLAAAPVTLQEEVPGENLRAFVAGDQVLACRILTGELDYRDDRDPRIEAIDLPPQVATDCLRIARLLDLLWTGIDFRRTPEGHYVFLEANPSPMFLGFEHRTGLPLTESLAAVLLAAC